MGKDGVSTVFAYSDTILKVPIIRISSIYIVLHDIPRNPYKKAYLCKRQEVGIYGK